MSEPVTYYDPDGTPRVMYSPTVAAAMVAAGLLLTEPPAPAPPAADVAPVPAAKRQRKGGK